MEELLFARQGQLGLITLNRPNALNALSLDMIKALQQQLILWEQDNSIKTVILRAVPGPAFCAGGDVRWLYSTGLKKDPRVMDFFWHEYRLNHFIHQFKKPYIALMDGITMGGGVGISLHGSHPIASERFIFAMPETSIGFFPDIGASYLLNRCPDSFGIYLGLTGNKIGAADAMKAGLVKQILSLEQMEHLVERLKNEDLSKDAHTRVSSCIKDLKSVAMNADIFEKNQIIASCFSKTNIQEIKSALQHSEEDWALDLAQILEQKSPLSLKITLAQLNRAKGLTLADCLKMDFDLVNHFMQGHDFYEGVRALLIDKDKNPKWNPGSLDLVSDELVVDYFERSNHVLNFER